MRPSAEHTGQGQAEQTRPALSVASAKGTSQQGRKGQRRDVREQAEAVVTGLGRPHLPSLHSFAELIYATSHSRGDVQTIWVT